MATDIRDDAPITFLIPGQRLDGATRSGDGTGARPPPLGLGGTVAASVRVGTGRAAGDVHRVTAQPGRDVVLLHIANGPTLVLHPATARDLLQAQTSKRRASTRGAGGGVEQESAGDVVEVFAQLRWDGLESSAVATRGASRGFLGDVLLRAVEIISGHVRDKAESHVADELVRRVDDQINEGVYRLKAEALRPLKDALIVKTMTAAPPGGATLVLVHGTFSETVGGFGKLWSQHPHHVRALFAHYAERVFALDHATLGKSPIDNALTLARSCPSGARLHLVTHSRGGLVAEVLARAAALKSLDASARELFVGRGHAAHRRTLETLIKHLGDNDIRVDRIVRVACPARGTLLASKRLDAYLSVLRWALDLAQVPVMPQLVDFIGGVAQRRTDPATIPGIAAMVPDSPLVQWLHAADEPVPGQLRVVAGDLQGDTVGAWLKTLMADAFFWTDNDLVVQTRSMYGGGARAVGATFMLDRGSRVTHFNYFGHKPTAEAVVNALIQDAPSGWRVIGPLSYSGDSALGHRGARRGSDDGLPASDKPAVFVLPGILGSHLKVDGKRIWLSWRLINGLKPLGYAEAPARPVEPDGPIGKVYDDLMDFLARSHEVIEFSFDWRKPIEDEGRRLGAMVDTAMVARERSGQPVRIVAHSMGGLVARAMQLECGAIWERMLAHPDARVLMLGTPNEGSWAPMQALSGDDTFGNTLVALGAPFQDHAARELMAQMPGFIQLQAALLDDALGLGEEKTWQKLADDDLECVREYNWWHHDELQLAVHRWGVPKAGVLERGVQLRRRLDEQRDKALPGFKDKLLLVAGHARFTPDGYEIGNEGLVYLNAPDSGDGRVPLSSAMLPGVRTWKLDCEHGELPGAKEAFDAYLELLENGSTTRLPMQHEIGASRGVGAAPPVAHVRHRPSRERDVGAPSEAEDDLNRLPRTGDTDRARTPESALRITLRNGDLKFVHQPLMVGHYASATLSGAERIVNGLIGHTMEDSLAMGQYPDRPGTHQLFGNTRVHRDNPLQTPRPELVIVVGLGAEGKLRGSELAYTVRMGVLALAQRLVERPEGPPLELEIASTLLGSGGSGISVGQAAQLVALGVRDADQTLRERNERLNPGPASAGTARRWPRVGELHLIELYLDRATEAWRALHLQAQALPNQYLLSDTVRSVPGAMSRPLDGGYRGADYDFISAVATVADPDDPSASGIHYTIDTERARTEVRAQFTQKPLVEELVARGSNDRNRDPQIGRTLLQLLVPEEMESFLGGTTEMLLELDRGTAGIPWEMLDTGSGERRGADHRPWAIRAKLLRKLRLDDYRQHVSDASPDAHALVIGEPLCSDPPYARLRGAREEAKAVRDRLLGAGALGPGRVTALISPDDTALPGPDAFEVIGALTARNWRILHISGHGMPPEKVGPEPKNPADPPRKPGNPRGVVLSNDSFLGPREIRTMRVVPELVFVNCCHLARRDPGRVLEHRGAQPYDRSRFASGVAEELIKIGVRCVIAAGWAVDDAAAATFAITFYDALLRGERFIDAVARAREATWTLGDNTWAAYQCYGDPEWVFRRQGADAQRPDQPLADRFASVVSPQSLTLALKSLVIGSNFQGLDREETRVRIRHLEARFAPSWGGIGAVAGAFGDAWKSAGVPDSAIDWYRRALSAEDGSASIKAGEQLGNLLARTAWNRVDKVHKTRRALEKRNRANGAAEAELAEARASLERECDAGRTAITQALGLLDGLISISPTMERLSLCGSAFKRLAMLEHAAERVEARNAALEAMRDRYEKAEAAARAAPSSDLFYPALNRMAADCIVCAGTKDWAGLDAEAVAAVRQALAIKVHDDPDFWSVVSQADLALYEAVAVGQLAERSAAIIAAYSDLHERVRDSGSWGSVRDQLNFVLPRYAERVPGPEAEAAIMLCEKVADFAR